MIDKKEAQELVRLALREMGHGFDSGFDGAQERLTSLLVEQVQKHTEMLRAEVQMLRGVGCMENGDGPCGVCRKCAWSEGAMQMQLRAVRACMDKRAGCHERQLIRAEGSDTKNAEWFRAKVDACDTLARDILHLDPRTDHPPPRFKIGQRVMAKIADRDYHAAVVQEVTEGPGYMLEWVDDEEFEGVPFWKPVNEVERE